MKRKIYIPVITALIIAAIYMYGEQLLLWMQLYASQYIVLTAIIATLFALFPIIPYPLIGGILGATFGPVLGALLTWIGSSAASIVMFIVVRYGYQDWGNKIIKRYEAIDKITTLFERNAFITIFFARLIPVIPSIIVNIYSALSRVSFVSYAIASSLGKVPAMILFAVVGNSFVTNRQDILYFGLFYLIFLLVVLLGYHLWKKQIEEKA
ncbi:TVP38/TMEM64 family protein [Bacillus alkalicellulosilyticus]|uniref:TVP38/TMEM64 family protein n=1 Tax=Alkalihalobacterium alkalicellulosilyticum TaxID=1912214 RepID=UPI000998B85B|nr:TVP38/TMEM64 family protein [Bacillus alkalicellulosilyticus]